MKKIPLGIQMYTLSMYEVEFVEKELKNYKLDKHQFLYLSISGIFPGIVQSSVAQYFNVNKSTAGRMIVKLIDKGYLRREKTANDRDFNVYLTEEGEILRDKIFDSVNRYEEIMLQKIADKDKFREVFLSIFDITRKARKSEEGRGKTLWKNLIKVH